MKLGRETKGYNEITEKGSKEFSLEILDRRK
jgi:hypothetical protein